MVKTYGAVRNCSTTSQSVADIEPPRCKCCDGANPFPSHKYDDSAGLATVCQVNKPCTTQTRFLVPKKLYLVTIKMRKPRRRCQMHCTQCCAGEHIGYINLVLGGRYWELGRLRDK